MVPGVSGRCGGGADAFCGFAQQIAVKQPRLKATEKEFRHVASA